MINLQLDVTDIREMNSLWLIMTIRHITDKVALEVLSQHDNWRVRREVAANPRISKNTASMSAHDKHWKVRLAAAGNKITDREGLAFLAKSNQWRIRLAVAHRYDNKIATLKALSEDNNFFVRQAALKAFKQIVITSYKDPKEETFVIDAEYHTVSFEV